MPEFRYTFTVNAPLSEVRAFHHDTSVLKKLTPFPIFVQISEFEPLAEGSNARFTLWFGPIPVRWHARHSDVGPNGFTDTQVSGPLKAWQHTHRFVALTPNQTRIDEHIIYAHDTGARGLLSRLLFNRPALTFLFSARSVLTRRGLARQEVTSVASQAG